MAEVTLAELLERTRLESGLRQNAYYDEDQIVRYLNAGGAELQDLFTAANQKYVIDEFDFTTTGPSDAIVALPDNFQQGHSLDIYPDTMGQTRTIRYLPNWLNRNINNGVFTLQAGGQDPVYTFLGGNIRFYPPQSVPAAPFRLYYTPMWKDLLSEQTLTWDIGTSAALSVGRSLILATGDNVDGPSRTWTFANGRFLESGAPVGALLNVSTGAQSGLFTIQTVISETQVVTFETPITETFGFGDSASVNDVLQFSFPNAAYTDDMEDGTTTFNFTDGFNFLFNGTYQIFEVLSSTTVQIPVWLPSASLTNPTAGTVSATWQSPGTQATLPTVMGPWSEYLVVYAAMAINIDRQRPIGELERKLQALKARIASILDNRQEEPQQPPLTRGMGSWDGWNSGGGWGGGWQ